MTAARAAGMRCVALVSDPTRALPADVAVGSLREAVAEPGRILGLG
jgi:beta-phosphoglucomutase-like phosphatase (HAD superfamily)